MWHIVFIACIVPSLEGRYELDFIKAQIHAIYFNAAIRKQLEIFHMLHLLQSWKKKNKKSILCLQKCSWKQKYRKEPNMWMAEMLYVFQVSGTFSGGPHRSGE